MPKPNDIAVIINNEELYRYELHIGGVLKAYTTEYTAAAEIILKKIATDHGYKIEIETKFN